MSTRYWSVTECRWVEARGTRPSSAAERWPDVPTAAPLTPVVAPAVPGQREATQPAPA